MKNFFKDLLFITIFIVLLIFCTNIFVLKGNTYGSDVISFYNLKKNTLDLVFFGSSHSYATFSPDSIEKTSGLNSYNFATQQQPIYITYHYMLEVLKTQKPKFFVLEVYMLSDDNDYTSEGVIRDAIDKLKFSKNKVDVIKASVENKDDYMSYYFNIIKYHSRYNSLTKADIYNGILYRGINNRGFKDLPSNEAINIKENNSNYIDITDMLDISNKNKDYLNKIVKLAKENNINLILVKAPSYLDANSQKKYNWIWNYAKSNNIYYLNYDELLDEVGLTNGDYYDEGHLSNSGAVKVSQHFANYINAFL